MKRETCLVIGMFFACLSIIGCTGSPKTEEKVAPLQTVGNQESKLYSNNAQKHISGKIIEMSKIEKEKLDTFFSNFSEAYVEEFPLNPPNETLLAFGVMHNLINRKYVQKDGGTYTLIPAAAVKESVDKYFGKPVKIESLKWAPVKDDYFKVEKAAGDNIRFSQIVSLSERMDGLKEAVVNVYTAPEAFDGDVHGSETGWANNSTGVPKKIATYKAVIDKSPLDNNRYILKVYTLLQKYN